MNNLTKQKKAQLFSDCLKAQDLVGLGHLDVKKDVCLLSKTGSKCRNINRY